MSHTIYSTNAIVLHRVDTGDADITIWLLTQDLGLLVAKATGARKETAKMRNHLQTLDNTSVSLVRGRYMWRIIGAESVTGVLCLEESSLRVFANISQFIMRMTVPGPSVDLYQLLTDIRREIALAKSGIKLQRIEILAMYKVLVVLGYMSSRVLDKDSVNLRELTIDINKAINESHM